MARSTPRDTRSTCVFSKRPARRLGRCVTPRGATCAARYLDSEPIMAAIAEISQGWQGLDLAEAAFMEPGSALARLETSESGLVESEASRRLHAVGPNAVFSHGARPLR